MGFSTADHQAMTRALLLARKGLYTTTPNPNVGCVIQNQHSVVGEGFHERAGEAHAEVRALQQAGEQARNATAYVTLEPCNHRGRTGPCTEALIHAGISRVVYGMEDPNPLVAGSGVQRLRDAGIQVDGPLLEDEAIELNRGYIKRMQLGRPYVRCKMAMSLDGRTAMASGESKWVTGPAAREDVQRLRARSCAIVTGIGTVLQDNPSLNVRLADLPQPLRQPTRVIVDSCGRLPAEADILAPPGRVLNVISEEKYQLDRDRVDTWCLPGADQRVDLIALIERLAAEGYHDVLIEAGAMLAGNFLRQGLVDELIIYVSAKLMGSKARPLFDLPLDTMAAQLPLRIRDIRAVGDDWRITVFPDPEG